MASEASAAHLEHLIARCAAGDAAACKLLYKNTAAQLFGVLRRILVREDLAQEALQDVYVSIWRNAKDYRAAKGAVFTWMVSIARYRAIDIKRSRKHEVHFADPVDYVPRGFRRRGGSRERRGARRRRQAPQATASAELNPMQRNAVCLAYLNGLTHEEVATRSARRSAR